MTQQNKEQYIARKVELIEAKARFISDHKHDELLVISAAEFIIKELEQMIDTLNQPTLTADEMYERDGF